ncbi:MAG TPA: GyrI-like domain-containing protein [Gemmatimonadaceae bacterium]|nr:GyrI-like domain-containing protein [Gemmatimonadaceae bacterium]
MSVSPVHVADAGPVRIAAVRRTVSRAELSRAVQAGCGRVWEYLRAQGVRGGRHVAIYRDGAITLDVGAEVSGAFTPSAEVVETTTPGGTIATATLLGPYQQLGAAHAAIRDWCVANGYTAAGPTWEIYGHWEPEWDADPGRIRTDVFHLVHPR